MTPNHWRPTDKFTHPNVVQTKSRVRSSLDWLLSVIQCFTLDAWCSRSGLSPSVLTCAIRITRACSGPHPATPTRSHPQLVNITLFGHAQAEDTLTSCCRLDAEGLPYFILKTLWWFDNSRHENTVVGLRKRLAPSGFTQDVNPGFLVSMFTFLWST